VTRSGRLRPNGLSVGRAVFVIAILLLVIVSMGMVVLSPLALRALDTRDDTDWERLSSIGQTYGAVSAIVAAIALLGVMISLVIQSREIREARKNARRSHHVELMRMAMDDPGYMECWGPYLTESFVAERQYTYVNLVVAHWYSEYDIGELSDPLLRATAASVLASAPGRRYWQNTGTFWRDNYSGRRARRFHQVLDEVYQEAIKRPTPTPPAAVEPESAPPARRWDAVLAAGGGAAAALLVARTVRHVLGRH
jgi:uncharacterized protein DUF6082